MLLEIFVLVRILIVLCVVLFERVIDWGNVVCIVCVVVEGVR